MAQTGSRHLTARIWTHFQPGFQEVAYTPLYWILAGLFLLHLGIVHYFLGRYEMDVHYFGYVRIIRNMVLFTLALLVYVGSLSVLARHRFRITRKQYVASMTERFYNRRSLVAGALLIAMFEIFFSEFVTSKSFYPRFIPFYADPMLAEMDRVLHFGKQPWEWLKPLYSSPVAYEITDFMYSLWFAIKYAMLIWFGFSLKRPDLRATFFITYFLAWVILGTFVAVVFSSAGPCYFGQVFPELPNPYAELMEAVRKVDADSGLIAVSFQNALWNNYVLERRDLVTGISAFPSMHVAVAFICFLAARHFGRIMTAAFFIYFLFVLIGSVALGWHYAVDGYFSIAAVIALWSLSAWLVRRFNLAKPVRKIEENPISP